MNASRWTSQLAKATSTRELINTLDQIAYEAESFLGRKDYSSFADAQASDWIANLARTHADDGVKVAALQTLVWLRMLAATTDDTDWVVSLIETCLSPCVVIAGLELISEDHRYQPVIEAYKSSSNADVRRVAQELLAELQG